MLLAAFGCTSNGAAMFRKSITMGATIWVFSLVSDEALFRAERLGGCPFFSITRFVTSVQ